MNNLLGLKTALLVAGLIHAPVLFSSQVSLSNQSAAPGTSIFAPVAFASEDSPVSGLQFDIEYDCSAINLSATFGDSARNAEKRLYTADLAPNKRRFIIVGFNQNLIADGVLINLFVTLNKNAAGVCHLRLSNLVATDPDGNPIDVTGTDGSVTVQGTVGQGMRLLQQGALSTGSLMAGPVAPGELITLIGADIGPPSPQQPVGSESSTILAGSSVLFDNAPAPLLYAAQNQINAIVPYQVVGKLTAQLQIESQGQVIAGLVLPVVTAVPAILTLDASGVGPGAILNQDSTVNSPLNPVDRGSVISVFATGAGQTDPPGLDAQIAGPILPSPLLPVFIRIGGIDALVLYAGAAPGLVAGVLQVNCMIPGGAPSGPAVPIVLTVGQANSQAGVTLAVK